MSSTVISRRITAGPRVAITPLILMAAGSLAGCNPDSLSGRGSTARFGTASTTSSQAVSSGQALGSSLETALFRRLDHLESEIRKLETAVDDLKKDVRQNRRELSAHTDNRGPGGLRHYTSELATGRETTAAGESTLLELSPVAMWRGFKVSVEGPGTLVRKPGDWISSFGQMHSGSRVSVRISFENMSETKTESLKIYESWFNEHTGDSGRLPPKFMRLEDSFGNSLYCKDFKIVSGEDTLSHRDGAWVYLLPGSPLTADVTFGGTPLDKTKPLRLKVGYGGGSAGSTLLVPSVIEQ